ncbi:zf-DHHC-domain-containing protein [Gloeopeniophorella convolvens]|nr:zf-DHHC-domain-containing protein [Gloeopeniophorella convolvens]
MPGACPQLVFACFKRVERWGDRLTGAAGPFFVATASALFVVGTVCFVDVVLTTVPWPWLSIWPYLLIIANLFAHYYFVCTVSPGFASDPPQHPKRSLIWAQKRKSPTNLTNGVHWSTKLNITPASTTQCSKCGETKPERTHHCRVCNRCILKYDHHCPVRHRPAFVPIPQLTSSTVYVMCSFCLAQRSTCTGINQCVGLHNERHFVMFMAYVVVATFWYAALGWPHLLSALGFDFDDNWEHRVSPVVFTIVYFLCVVMCLAVGTMLAWHLWSVAVGETSVESQDHEHYRRVAKSRGESFQNSYDLGKLRNLQLFFNIGPDGYPLYTLFLPLRVPPYTDGRSWARKPGYERHHGVRIGEELTDEEDE